MFLIISAAFALIDSVYKGELFYFGMIINSSTTPQFYFDTDVK